MANDKFVMTARQAAELDCAFERNGFTPALVKDLSKGDFLSLVRAALEGNAEIKTIELLFKRDMRKEGWKLVETRSRRIQAVADLTLAGFLKNGESRIIGETMRERAIEAGNDFGQEDAEWLLEHQSEIPKEWRSYYLIFPGTVWLSGDRDRYVPCLFWDDGRWCLDFYWLDGVSWNGDGRLLSLSK